MFFGTLRIEKVIFSHRPRTEASHFQRIYKTFSFFLETGDVQCRFNSNQMLSLYLLVLLF